MKTKILFLTAVLSVFLSVCAQAQQRGFRSGISITTFSETGDLYDNDHTTVSFTAGAFRAFTLTGDLNLVPELNYARKGRSEHNMLPGRATQADYYVHYLQIPLLLQYANQTISRPGSQIHFNAGPYVGFALDDKLEGLQEPENTEQWMEEQGHDLGLSMGMGYQRPLRHNHLRMDLKYDMGLRQVANMPDDFRTKALSFTMGYAF